LDGGTPAIGAVDSKCTADYIAIPGNCCKCVLPVFSRMDEIITTVSSQKKNQNNITKIFEIRITSQK
jgi:hypothetical protein